MTRSTADACCRATSLAVDHVRAGVAAAGAGRDGPGPGPGRGGGAGQGRGGPGPGQGGPAGQGRERGQGNSEAGSALQGTFSLNVSAGTWVGVWDLRRVWVRVATQWGEGGCPIGEEPRTGVAGFFRVELGGA